MPMVRKLEADLWEVRIHLATGRIARVCFTVRLDEMVLLHGYIKKTQKASPQDLALLLSHWSRWSGWPLPWADN
jgi:phage-related protein